MYLHVSMGCLPIMIQIQGFLGCLFPRQRMWRGRFVQQHQGAIEILVLSLLGFSFLSFERNVFPGNVWSTCLPPIKHDNRKYLDCYFIWGKTCVNVRLSIARSAYERVSLDLRLFMCWFCQAPWYAFSVKCAVFGGHSVFQRMSAQFYAYPWYCQYQKQS